MPVWPGTTQVVHGDVPVAAGCATVVCRWRPGGAPVEPRWHDGATLHDKTRTKRVVRSVLISLYHITVMSSKKKTPGMWCRSVWIEYLPQRKNLSRKPCRLRNHHQTTILRIAYLLPQCHWRRGLPRRRCKKRGNYQTTVHQILLHITLRNSSS